MGWRGSNSPPELLSRAVSGVRQVWDMSEGWHGTARPVLQHSPVTHGTSHTLPAVAVKINLPKLFAEETSREPPHHVLQQGTGSWGAQGRLRTLPWGPRASEMQRACVTNIHGIHNIRTYGGKYSQSE